jgi:AraC-like DNA-binding protein
VLSLHTHLRREGMELAEVACRHPRGHGHEVEHSNCHALVLVRRGCFARSADGRRELLDPTLAYCMNPGQEQRFEHPHEGGDDCTSLTLSAELVASLWGGEPSLPDMPLAVGPELDLEHRLLLARARRGGDEHELVERALALCASALERSDPGRVASGRPATARARRRLVDAARELLAEDPGRSLGELATALAVSPHHLSRVFHALTGHTLARHRVRLRVRDALERLGGGERDLARLAADVGLADQSHLCRALARETGGTPAALRAALG